MAAAGSEERGILTFSDLSFLAHGGRQPYGFGGAGAFRTLGEGGVAPVGWGVFSTVC